MDKGSEIATKGMIMLVIINSTGIQVLPTTVIGLRALAGSVAPSAIIWPTVVATFVPTIIGIILVKLIYRKGVRVLFKRGSTKGQAGGK